MEALIGWRSSTLQSPPGNIPSRGPSPIPLSDEEPLSESDEREPPYRPESDHLNVARKPTSSTWSRWWSRSRNNKDTEGSKKTSRPNIRETASDIVSEICFFAFILSHFKIKAVTQGSKSEILPVKQQFASPVPFPTGSAPSSTPVSTPLTRPQPTNGAPGGKRFAKTLRLTSDQLVGYISVFSVSKVNHLVCSRKL